MSILQGKFEHVQEIKSRAISIMDYLGRKKYNLPKICPDKISSFEVLEGNWGVKNTVLLGRYLLDGKELISKEILEDIDEKKSSVTYNIIGGDMMKFYKALKVIIQFQVDVITSSDEKKNYVKSTFEYEKLNPEIPPPEQFKDFVAEIIKMIDEYVSSACMKSENAP